MRKLREEARRDSIIKPGRRSDQASDGKTADCFGVLGLRFEVPSGVTSNSGRRGSRLRVVFHADTYQAEGAAGAAVIFIQQAIAVGRYPIVLRKPAFMTIDSAHGKIDSFKTKEYSGSSGGPAVR